jgi:hypothetical protein
MASSLTAKEQTSEFEAEKKDLEFFVPPSDDIQPHSNQVPEPGPDAPPATQEWVSGFKLLPIITAITLGCFLMLLDTSIIATATPRITSDFHSLLDVGWYGASYQLAW